MTVLEYLKHNKDKIIKIGTLNGSNNVWSDGRKFHVWQKAEP